MRETVRAACLLGGVLVLSLTASLGIAQNAPPAVQAAAQSAASLTAANTGVLQEVVVTATHIATDVNRVPMTIAAVTQQNLDMIGITDASQLAEAIPGLTTGGTFLAGKQNFTIRGIGATTGAATTGVYLDDVPLTQYFSSTIGGDSGAAVPELFDLERVEVLEGPQGTLYGGSSEGGTVRFITPTPSLTQYSGFTRAQVEDTQWGAPGYLLGVAGGGPIVAGQSGFRVSLVEHKIGGWLDEYNPYNTGQSPDAKDGTNLNWTEEFAARVAFLVKLTENTSLEFFYYHHQSYENNTDLTGPDAPLGSQSFTIPQACYNTAAATKLHVPTVTCPPADAPVPAGIYERPPETVGPFPFLNGTDAAIDPDDYLDVYPANSLTKLQVPAMTLAYNFSGGTQLKWISSYVRTYTDGNGFDRDEGGRLPYTSEYPFAADFPLFPLDMNYAGQFPSDNYANTVTEELRWTNPGSADSRWSWVAGLFYTRARETAISIFQTNVNQAVESFYGVSAPLYLGYPEVPTGNSDNYISNTEEAAYGNVNFNVTRKLKLTGGVRLSNVEFNYYQNDWGQEDAALENAPGSITMGSIHNRPVSPLATVTYSFTPNDLVYATAAKGFRGGGINTPLIAACNIPLAVYGLTTQDIPSHFGPDEVWSYEIGLKMRLLDNHMQINVSPYWINWTGIQTVISTLGGGCNTNFTENAGKAISRGVDLQVQYQPAQAVNINLAVSYDDAYYPNNVNGPQPLSGAPPTTVVAAGERLPVPVWTGTMGTQYNFNFGGQGREFIRADWQFQGKYQSGPPVGIAGHTPYDINPAWYLLNMRAGMNFQWGDVELYSTNVLNRQAWENPEDAAGQSSGGKGVCLNQVCNEFLTYSPLITEEVPTPRVIGLEFNYYF